MGRGRRAGSSPSALFCGTQTPGRFVRQLKMDFFGGGGASSSVSAALMAGGCAVWEGCLSARDPLPAVVPGWRRFVRTCRSRRFVIRERFTRPPGCPKRYASRKSLDSPHNDRVGSARHWLLSEPGASGGSPGDRSSAPSGGSLGISPTRGGVEMTPSTKTTTQPSYPASSHASRDHSPGGSHASTGLCIDRDSRS